MLAARHYGIVLDPTDCGDVSLEDIPSTASLCSWMQDAGLRARAVRLRWRQLVHLRSDAPVVLLFADGTAGLMTSADADHNVIFLKDPCAPSSAAAIVVDERGVERVWSGGAVLLRTDRRKRGADAPFSLSWLAGLVLQKSPLLRDIGVPSLTLSFLTIFPPLLVMTVVDK